MDIDLGVLWEQPTIYVHHDQEGRWEKKKN